MPFNNSITRFDNNTLSHFDVFNDVNEMLLENTIYNKTLVEKLYSLYENQQAMIDDLKLQLEEIKKNNQPKGDV